MKYLVIPKAMNPSRNSHCKTDQIMRNTFLFPRPAQREKRKGDVVFVLSSWVTGNASSIKTLDRKSEQRQAPLVLRANRQGRWLEAFCLIKEVHRQKFERLDTNSNCGRRDCQAKQQALSPVERPLGCCPGQGEVLSCWRLCWLPGFIMKESTMTLSVHNVIGYYCWIWSLLSQLIFPFSSMPCLLFVIFFSKTFKLLITAIVIVMITQLIYNNC